MPIYLSDPTLTTDSVAESTELVNDWKSLKHDIYRNKGIIPNDRFREIQQRCSTKRDIAHECASYYSHCHPQPSWTHLTRSLYRQGELAAVEKLKPFLPLRGKCQGISINHVPIPTVWLCMCFDGCCLGAQIYLAMCRIKWHSLQASQNSEFLLAIVATPINRAHAHYVYA